MSAYGPTHEQVKKVLEMSRIIPAAPGWRLLLAWPGENGGAPTSATEPIIAWMLRLSVPSVDSDARCSYCDPITVDGTPSSEMYAVISPDGDWSIPTLESGSGGVEEALSALLTPSENKPSSKEST